MYIPNKSLSDFIKIYDANRLIQNKTKTNYTSIFLFSVTYRIFFVFTLKIYHFFLIYLFFASTVYFKHFPLITMGC